MPDLKINATTGMTGGTALTTDQTTQYLRKDGTYQNPFLPQHTQVPATPSSGVAPYSSAGGNSLLGGGAMDAFVNGAGLVVLSGGVVPGSVLTAASTVASTATETQLAGLAVPAADASAGAIYALWLSGVYSDTGTPTLAFGLRWGGAAGTSIATIAATTLGSAVSNLAFTALALIQFWTATTVTGYIVVDLGTSNSTNATTRLTGVSGATAVTVVSNVAKTMSVTATWGTSSASNTISAMSGFGTRMA